MRDILAPFVRLLSSLPQTTLSQKPGDMEALRRSVSEGSKQERRMMDLRSNSSMTFMKAVQNLASPAYGAMVEPGLFLESSFFYCLLCTDCVPGTSSRTKMRECSLEQQINSQD